MRGDVSEPLLVVDLQRGFINEYTQHIPGRIKKLIETGDYSPILFTRFVNPRPDHDTREARVG